MGTSVRDSRSDDYDVVDYIENITMNGGNSSDNKNIENNNQRIGFDIGIISISSEIINKTNHQFGEDNFNVILLKTDKNNINIVTGEVNNVLVQGMTLNVSVGNIHVPNIDTQFDSAGVAFRAGGGFHTFELAVKYETKSKFFGTDIKISTGVQMTMGGYSAEAYAGYTNDGKPSHLGIGAKVTGGMLGGGAFLNIDF